MVAVELRTNSSCLSARGFRLSFFAAIALLVSIIAFGLLVNYCGTYILWGSAAGLLIFVIVSAVNGNKMADNGNGKRNNGK